jgi:DNA helicase HerA-like ATPase
MVNVIQFARVDFRNDVRIFGIKDEDRLLHLYIIGKTGTGKSSLIETMALQDAEGGNGFAVIDPHGDLVDRVAARISKKRRDVIYLNVPDPTQPYGYNPLRHVREDRIALAASRTTVQESNHRHRGPLRARRERPCGHRAEQREELAALHV